MSKCSPSVLLSSWATVFLLAALMTGCEPSATPLVGQDDLQVTVVDRSGYDAVLADLRGKVILVDCWATWCIPCLQQLPHTGELANRHQADEFAAVTLCLDDPEKLQQIRQRLRVVDSTGVVHLISEFGSGTKSLEAFDIPGGALPHYKLYDRQGKLRRTFDLDPSAQRQFTTADIDAAVAELLSN